MDQMGRPNESNTVVADVAEFEPFCAVVTVGRVVVIEAG